MNETKITPSTEAVRRRYRSCRFGTSYEESGAEFERWLAAHDQGIRDACRPPELTAREHLEAAFEAAYPVPKWRKIPAGVPIIERWEDGDFRVLAKWWTVRTNDCVEVRTLEPLPPVIPDDCEVVIAYTVGNSMRRPFIRDPHPSHRGWWRDWDLDFETSDLIDPKPVPEEER